MNMLEVEPIIGSVNEKIPLNKIVESVYRMLPGHMLIKHIRIVDQDTSKGSVALVDESGNWETLCVGVQPDMTRKFYISMPTTPQLVMDELAITVLVDDMDKSFEQEINCHLAFIAQENSHVIHELKLFTHNEDKGHRHNVISETEHKFNDSKFFGCVNLAYVFKSLAKTGIFAERDVIKHQWACDKNFCAEYVCHDGSSKDYFTREVVTQRELKHRHLMPSIHTYDGSDRVKGSLKITFYPDYHLEFSRVPTTDTYKTTIISPEAKTYWASLPQK